MGNQLWAGETPDSNPGLQDNSLALLSGKILELLERCDFARAREKKKRIGD
jgi:hypothetical protein